MLAILASFCKYAFLKLPKHQYTQFRDTKTICDEINALEFATL